MEKYLVLDCETANSLEEPLCYDIGFAVIDETGKVYETHSYVIADVFLDKELMDTAYYKEKCPRYWEGIKNGTRELKRSQTVKFIIRDVVKKYDIKVFMAHNARFDNKALKTSERYLTKSKYRYYLPYGLEVWDTLKMSRMAFREDPEYIRFCFDNGYLTANGQLRFTAEVIYRFLTNNIHFAESHTGLEDVMIEKEIFVECWERGVRDGRIWDENGNFLKLPPKKSNKTSKQIYEELKKEDEITEKFDK